MKTSDLIHVFSQSKRYVQAVLHTQTDATVVDTAELSKEKKIENKKEKPQDQF